MLSSEQKNNLQDTQEKTGWVEIYQVGQKNKANKSRK